MHFLGQNIDQRNCLNVENCLILEAGFSVSDERMTVANVGNKMRMTKYVNLVCYFAPDDFLNRQFRKTWHSTCSMPRKP